ncbi:hypothetical protein BJ875DRAFT_526982 [Amylocarpus encephaloides]|uniref:Uncharacterized protein n=1 Tax=Amylocarpus encephaloides TaxID=45428 RepID=A0A9P8BZG0_9HELO|nr:hypothetical protein BJ875DRAFT_526982 [Amylocarpus encephaloides]
MAAPISVAELVVQMHDNIDEIHKCVQTLSDTKIHDDEMERLERDREAKIEELRLNHEDDLRQLAELRGKEKAGLQEKRKQEEVEIMERRRREDEERRAAIQAEEEENQRLKAEEDERRGKELDEKRQSLRLTVEEQLEQMEDEMERKVEEGKRTLAELDEKRRVINAQIEAALNKPTVIPTITYRSRAKTHGSTKTGPAKSTYPPAPNSPLPPIANGTTKEMDGKGTLPLEHNTMSSQEQHPSVPGIAKEVDGDSGSVERESLNASRDVNGSETTDVSLAVTSEVEPKTESTISDELNHRAGSLGKASVCEREIVAPAIERGVLDEKIVEELEAIPAGWEPTNLDEVAESPLLLRQRGQDSPDVDSPVERWEKDNTAVVTTRSDRKSDTSDKADADHALGSEETIKHLDTVPTETQTDVGWAECEEFPAATETTTELASGSMAFSDMGSVEPVNALSSENGDECAINDSKSLSTDESHDESFSAIEDEHKKHELTEKESRLCHELSDASTEGKTHQTDIDNIFLEQRDPAEVEDGPVKEEVSRNLVGSPNVDTPSKDDGASDCKILDDETQPLATMDHVIATSGDEAHRGQSITVYGDNTEQLKPLYESGTLLDHGCNSQDYVAGHDLENLQGDTLDGIHKEAVAGDRKSEQVSETHDTSTNAEKSGEGNFDLVRNQEPPPVGKEEGSPELVEDRDGAVNDADQIDNQHANATISELEPPQGLLQQQTIGHDEPLASSKDVELPTDWKPKNLDKELPAERRIDNETPRNGTVQNEAAPRADSDDVIPRDSSVAHVDSLEAQEYSSGAKDEFAPSKTLGIKTPDGPEIQDEGSTRRSSADDRSQDPSVYDTPAYEPEFYSYSKDGEPSLAEPLHQNLAGQGVGIDPSLSVHDQNAENAPGEMPIGTQDGDESDLEQEISREEANGEIAPNVLGDNQQPNDSQPEASQTIEALSQSLPDRNKDHEEANEYDIQLSSQQDSLSDNVNRDEQQPIVFEPRNLDDALVQEPTPVTDSKPEITQHDLIENGQADEIAFEPRTLDKINAHEEAPIIISSENASPNFDHASADSHLNSVAQDLDLDEPFVPVLDQQEGSSLASHEEGSDLSNDDPQALQETQNPRPNSPVNKELGEETLHEDSHPQNARPHGRNQSTERSQPEQALDVSEDDISATRDIEESSTVEEVDSNDHTIFEQNAAIVQQTSVPVNDKVEAEAGAASLTRDGERQTSQALNGIPKDHAVQEFDHVVGNGKAAELSIPDQTLESSKDLSKETPLPAQSPMAEASRGSEQEHDLSCDHEAQFKDAQVEEIHPLESIEHESQEKDMLDIAVGNEISLPQAKSAVEDISIVEADPSMEDSEAPSNWEINLEPEGQIQETTIETPASPDTGISNNGELNHGPNGGGMERVSDTVAENNRQETQEVNAESETSESSIRADDELSGRPQTQLEAQPDMVTSDRESLEATQASYNTIKGAAARDSDSVKTLSTKNPDDELTIAPKPDALSNTLDKVAQEEGEGDRIDVNATETIHEPTESDLEDSSLDKRLEISEIDPHNQEKEDLGNLRAASQEDLLFDAGVAQISPSSEVVDLHKVQNAAQHPTLAQTTPAPIDPPFDRPSTPLGRTMSWDQHMESPATVMNTEDLFDDDDDSDVDPSLIAHNDVNDRVDAMLIDREFLGGKGLALGAQETQEHLVSNASEARENPSVEVEHHEEGFGPQEVIEESNWPFLSRKENQSEPDRHTQPPTGLFANLINTIRPDMSLVRQMSDIPEVSEYQAQTQDGNAHARHGSADEILDGYLASHVPGDEEFSEHTHQRAFTLGKESSRNRSQTTDTVPSFGNYAHSDYEDSPPATPIDEIVDNAQDALYNEHLISSSWPSRPNSFVAKEAPLKSVASSRQEEFDPYNPSQYSSLVTPKTSHTKLVEEARESPENVFYMPPGSAHQIPRRSLDSGRFEPSLSRSPRRSLDSGQLAPRRSIDASGYEGTIPLLLSSATGSPNPLERSERRPTVSQSSSPQSSSSSSLFQKTRSLFEASSSGMPILPSLSGWQSSPPPKSPVRASPASVVKERPSSLYHVEPFPASSLNRRSFDQVSQRYEDDDILVPCSLDQEDRPPSPGFTIPGGFQSPSRSGSLKENSRPNSLHESPSRSGPSSLYNNSIAEDDEATFSSSSKKSAFLPFGKGGLEDSIHNPAREPLLGNPGKHEGNRHLLY